MVYQEVSPTDIDYSLPLCMKSGDKMLQDFQPKTKTLPQNNTSLQVTFRLINLLNCKTYN